MKKIIFLLIISIIGISNIKAQDNDLLQFSDLKAHVDSLSSKLNTLQRDYEYLYCNSLINDCLFNIKDFSNEINIKSNQILINCYHSQFDFKLYTSYKNLFDAYNKYFNSLKEKADVVKTTIFLKMLVCNFSESEVNVLSEGYNVIENSLNTTEKSLNHFNVVLDIYKY